MNSNSESPIYLIASADKESGKVTISGIGIYKKYELVESIDIKFDEKGNAIPYNNTENGSHAHKWNEVAPGKIGRKRYDKNNHLPIKKKYQVLIDKIVEFNKKGMVWKKGVD